MKNENYSKGKNGEQLALEYLTNKGFVLKDKNFRTNWGEIDLIMANKNTLVFVEVKLKVGDKYGNPEEMISKSKINKIKQLANYYVSSKNNCSRKFKTYRLDAVCIVLDTTNNLKRISHYENIDK